MDAAILELESLEPKKEADVSGGSAGGGTKDQEDRSAEQGSAAPAAAAGTVSGQSIATAAPATSSKALSLVPIEDPEKLVSDFIPDPHPLLPSYPGGPLLPGGVPFPPTQLVFNVRRANFSTFGRRGRHRRVW